MRRHQVELDIVLPSDAKACDACVTRLVDAVQTEPGVSSAHVDESIAGSPKLCVHYDPTALRIEELRSLITQAGATLSTRFEHISAGVTGLRHQRQASAIEALLANEPGVLHVAVAFGAQWISLEYDPSKTSRSTLRVAAERSGISIADAAGAATSAAQHAAPRVEHEDGHDHEGEADHGHEGDHDHGGPFGENSELVFSLVCGLLTVVGWGLSKFGFGPAWTPLLLYVTAYAFGSWFTIQEVVVALRGRRFEIDFLMLLAAVGAAVLGEWFEGALLLFLFTLGHALESFAMGRAREAIAALQELVPETAIRLDSNGQEVVVPVGDLAVGDPILVKPNTRIPADGYVVAGFSAVDQAPITGESVPVDKRPVPEAQDVALNAKTLAAEHRVFAGTINGSGALTLVVTKRANDSTISRVVKMVAEAETQRSPTQQFTKRFERVFVPIILSMVVLLIFAWVVLEEPWTASFYRAMAVLVAASPCALAIATPSAVLSAVARAARGGVLIKGGAHLESLGLVQAIAFDKTGTLTEGKPKLTDVVAISPSTDAALLTTAAAVERLSDHPLASAIVNAAVSRLPQGESIPEATEAKAVVGFGVRAELHGATVLIGKPGMFTGDNALPQEVEQAAKRLEADGRTVMVVKSGEQFLGVLGVMDTPRSSARLVMEELRRLGVEKTIMLTGDNQAVADAVAKSVGIGIARGNLLPHEKVAAITELARSWGSVAMVGDGVNDAPAMANATVGVAMGAAGSDVALETAGIALMADDLQALPFAVGLSRAARRIIRQNLWASLGMVAFLVPATIFGFASIGVAVALHEGSTLVVVANALRLLAYRDGRAAR